MYLASSIPFFTHRFKTNKIIKNMTNTSLITSIKNFLKKENPDLDKINSKYSLLNLKELSSSQEEYILNEVLPIIGTRNVFNKDIRIELSNVAYNFNPFSKLPKKFITLSDLISILHDNQVYEEYLTYTVMYIKKLMIKHKVWMFSFEDLNTNQNHTDVSQYKSDNTANINMYIVLKSNSFTIPDNISKLDIRNKIITLKDNDVIQISAYTSKFESLKKYLNKSGENHLYGITKESIILKNGKLSVKKYDTFNYLGKINEVFEEV